MMNYKDVDDAVKKEIFDERKFEKIQTMADEHLSTVRKKVNTVTINLQTNNVIKSGDNKQLLLRTCDKREREREREREKIQ